MGYAEEVLADTPYAYWRLSDTGTTAVDASGNSRNATYSGTYTQTATSLLADTSNSACQFGGGRVTSGELPDLANKSYTVECLFKATSVGVSSQTIVARDNTAGNRIFVIRIGSDAKIQFQHAEWAFGDRTSAYTPSEISANTTYHLVCVMQANPSRMMIWLNGVKVTDISSVSAQIYNYYTECSIADWLASSQPFSGSIDEVSLYDTKLSDARIEAHYTASITASEPTYENVTGATSTIGLTTGTITASQSGTITATTDAATPILKLAPGTTIGSQSGTITALGSETLLPITTGTMDWDIEEHATLVATNIGLVPVGGTSRLKKVASVWLSDVYSAPALRFISETDVTLDIPVSFPPGGLIDPTTGIILLEPLEGWEPEE